MAFITWDSRFSVGIPVIDQQHMKLVDYINELHDAMKIGKAKDVLSEIIRNLVNYTNTHFTTEEKYMSTNGYPGFQDHKKEHAEFVNKVTEFQKNFNNGSSSVSIDIMNFLRNWILNHILVEDKKYVPFFQEKGIK